MSIDKNNRTTAKVGLYSSLALAVLTLITFFLGMMAVPPAGPYCLGNCMDYPFSDLLRNYPRDYFWMYFAIFQLFAFIVFIVSNHYNASQEKRIFSFISISFGLIAATVLLITYFTQFAIVPISMMKEETEGIALITQYNGHGIFVAMEELGYILMSLALFFLVHVFTKSSRLERAIRLILIIQLVLMVLSFILYSIKFGIDRSYRFEVAAISICWLSLIVLGILLSIYYNRLKKAIQ